MGGRGLRDLVISEPCSLHIVFQKLRTFENPHGIILGIPRSFPATILPIQSFCTRGRTQRCTTSVQVIGRAGLAARKGTTNSSVRSVPRSGLVVVVATITPLPHVVGTVILTGPKPRLTNNSFCE